MLKIVNPCYSFFHPERTKVFKKVFIASAEKSIIDRNPSIFKNKSCQNSLLLLRQRNAKVKI
jgi:hypothetical protein